MVPWLLLGAELGISRLVSQLRFEDTGDTLRKAPLQEHHLQSLLPLCNLDDAHDLLMVTILYMGHDGLLRSGDIVSGLRTRDVGSWVYVHECALRAIEDPPDGGPLPGILQRPPHAERGLSNAPVVHPQPA